MKKGKPKRGRKPNPEPKVDPSLEGYTLHSKTLVELSGLGHKQLTRVAEQGYFPHCQKMYFHLGKTVTGIIKYFRDQASNKTGKIGDVRLAREEQRLLREKRETDLALELVVDKEKTRRAISQCVTSAKTRLLSIPAGVAPLVCGLTDPHEVEEKLRTYIFDALDDLSGILK